MAAGTIHFHRRRALRRLLVWALGLVPLLALAAAVVGLAGRADAAGPHLVPIRGHQPVVPPGATPLGPATTSTVLPILVTLQPRDPAALAAEAKAVSDPSSPQYHRFLTTKQFAQQYGPTPATTARVTAALRSEGLTVGTPAATGLSLPVSGTVAQLQAAFATPIDRYRLSSGKTGYHNRKAPEVPSTVAAQIQGIIGLDTLSPPQPTTLPAATPGGTRPGGLGVTPVLAPGQPQPTGTSCTNSINTTMSSYGALDAVDLAQAYSFDSLYGAGDYGSGATVALVEMYSGGYSSNDISIFAGCYGITLGPGQITQRNVGSPAGALGGGTIEAELDIETVLSMAPKANIEVYEGSAIQSIYSVINAIVSDDTAKIVSVSWTNGCEAYTGSSIQTSENTLFQAAATEGQSIFVAAGDQGSEGCNVNGVNGASTGSHPTAQAVDPGTGTLYVANQSGSSVSVIGEGTNDNGNFTTPSSVSTGSTPDAVALDSADGKVFVANSGSSSLTEFATSTCNQSRTTGCSTPTTITSSGHLSSPSALAVNGTTLYVANGGNSTVSVYNATTNAFVASVLLPLGTPSSLAVDAANGTAYVGVGGAVSSVDYFNASTCNASVTTGCAATPATIGLLQNPAAMVVDDAAGNLYVANTGSGGGIQVISLSSHAKTGTVATTGTGFDGTGLAESLALSPSGNQVLAVLNGLAFPGNVLASINPATNTITATVGLENGSDTTGAVVADGTRDLAWVTDTSAAQDIVQNLNLGVSDPANQPYVTAVGGTTVSALGPAPTEGTWNDQLHYAEGAGGGGISQTFAMPSWQQPLGTVTGSSGTPCGNGSGDCREVPDVSADADPSTGYVVYDHADGMGYNWTAVGGTSGAAPLWAAVLAVAASADQNTAGYGSMNPILYALAQQSPNTYFNDVTTGNNDYNGTDGGQFSAGSGYDMATGLGTPITSALATGLTSIPLDVSVSGSQVYGQGGTFTASAQFGGSSGTPFGVTLNTSGLSCSQVNPSTAVSPALAVGSYTLAATSCSGATLGGSNGADYSIVYTSASNDFTVSPAPLTVTASSPSMTYGGTVPTITPGYSGFVNGQNQSVLSAAPTCSTTATSSSPASPPTYPSNCSGAAAANYTISYTGGAVTVNKAPLTITASNGSMTYGGTVPTITAGYGGFVNGDNANSLTTKPTCSTAATSSSPVASYASTCSGAVDPNYTFGYVAGTVAVSQAPLSVTASSPSVAYGTTPAVTAAYGGFVNGDTASSLTTKPTCSTAATSSSPVAGSPYASSCSGAVDSNYAFTYVPGSVTISAAPLTITASSPSMTYGGTVPTITPGYGGFVNGENSSVLTSAPTCSTSATSSSPASPPTYPSGCSGAAAANYAISYLSGAVTVNKAPLSVAVGGSQTYGGAPSFAATAPQPLPPGVTGVGTAGVICQQVQPGTAITSTMAAGTYTLVGGSCSGATLNGPGSADYAVAYTASANDFTVSGGPPAPPPPPPPPPRHGYWLVGSDGGIFTFGSANFYGSTGSIRLQRPVVGITPTRDEAGYWLVASDGGIFSFGDSGFYGSIPGLGLHPAGSGLPNSLNAPIVGMVPSADGGGYFMVASDGGVFAFGDARFEGSCPGIGGCGGGPAVAVVPDAGGSGYWLVTANGSVFTFGDAPYFGAPGSQGSSVTSAVRTPDGQGYYVLLANGMVFAYGDARPLGGPVGAVGGFDPASAIFTDSDGGGYWVASAVGAVFTYGDAPNSGSMVGTPLNGSIIAATGF